MGQSCSHCFQGLRDCCTAFGAGCEACYICMKPCCSELGLVFSGCSCAAIALCLECKISNPLLVRDTSQPEITQALAPYTHQTNYYDEWFGDVVLLEHKETKALAVLKVYDFYYQDDFNAHKQAFAARTNLKHDNIIQLKEVLERTEVAFCTSTYKSILIFDYVLCDLATEYKIRIEQQNYYTENQFWPMMYQAASGLAYLHSQNISHGSVRMRNIYISNQYLKVADPQLFEHPNDYALVFRDRKQLAFLSPELMNELSKGESNPTVDQFKSDVYSLGMVFLQLCSKQPSSQCYNYDQCVIFEDKISSNLQNIKINCHDTLYFVIKNMLSPKVSQRYTMKQVVDALDKNPKARAQLCEIIAFEEPEVKQEEIFSPSPNLDNDYSVVGGTGFGLDMYSLGLMGQQEKSQVLTENVKEKYPDGSKYIGQKKGGQRHGKGKFVHQDNSYYDGNWKDNKMSGKGALYSADGKVIYDGQWLNDQYNGVGTEYNQHIVPMLQLQDPTDLTNVSWSKFEGNFKHDLRDGFGTLILSNGDKFVGHFKNGIPNGHGTYTMKNNTVIQGQWIQGLQKK